MVKILSPNRQLTIIGLGSATTGLGRVLLEIIQQLKKRWEVTVILQGSDGSFPILEGVHVLATNSSSLSLEVDKEILRNLKAIKSDCVLILAQPWKCSRLLTSIRIAAPNAKIALYVAIEGRPYDNTIARSAAIADLCIVYTRAIYDQLKKFGLNLIVIGHGCDPRCEGTIPISDRKQLRRKLFSNYSELWEKPLILNTNRIYFRKRFDLCVAGFAKAAEVIDANLYLHIPGLSRYEASKLRYQIESLNIKHRIFINLLNPLGEPIAFEDLILLMQSCDVGMTTSMGEGWGLGSLEHAATGAAQIVPDHIGFKENWGPDNAIFIPCDDPLPIMHEAVEMFPPSISGIANALISMFQEPGVLELMSNRAQKCAKSIKRGWDIIGQQFDSALQILVKG